MLKMDTSGMEDLHRLADLKEKLTRFQSLSDDFTTALEGTKAEDTRLEDYRNELEVLSQEKQMHVEELRQINNDINVVDQIIRQSEEEQRRHLDAARRNLGELYTLRASINEIRLSLGQPPLADDFLHVDPQDLDMLLADAAFMRPQWPFGQLGGLVPQGGLNGGGSVPSIPGMSIGVNVQDAGSIVGNIGRQQAPPMKTCGSCQQLIHRNAPICPLCKSKSRSRHPKRGKKTMGDD